MSAGPSVGSSAGSSSRNKVATYSAPWPIYALAWSSHVAPPPGSAAGSSSHGSSSTNSSLRRQHSISKSPSRFDDGTIPHGSRIAIGSLMEEYSNSIQVLGYIGERDSAGQPRLSTLATAPHAYPATKIAFQPSSLSTSSSSSSSDRGYMSPLSKSAKRGSWGAAGGASPGGSGGNAAAPEQWLYPNDEAHDGFPNRELLASTADCLRIWECSRNADWGTAPPWDDVEGGGDEENGYRYRRSSGQPSSSKMRFNLREKSVLAHVSHERTPRTTRRPSCSLPLTAVLQSKSSMSPPAPLTSFSWNHPSPNLIVTSSIDTTCTVWDLPTRTALTQLIAHDREVYDVDWCPGSSDVFASVGADGSVRVFDLRSLEHSTIIYETAGPPPPSSSSRPGTGMSTSSSSRNGSTAGGGGGGGGSGGQAAPLLRIAFNPWDANYLATFHLESDAIQILDVRAPGLPILELKGHKGGINAIAWGPPSATGTLSHSSSLSSGSSSSASGNSISKGMISTASDDSQVLVYDLASSTLRSASAQGRRSRNSNAASAAGGASGGATASPAPSSAGGGAGHHHSLSHSMSSASLSQQWGNGIPSELPFLAYDAQEMVNNVAWFRPGTNAAAGGAHSRGASMSNTASSASSSSVIAEWNEFAGNAKGGGRGGGGGAYPREDWMACVAGKELRALRVAA